MNDTHAAEEAIEHAIREMGKLIEHHMAESARHRQLALEAQQRMFTLIRQRKSGS